MKKNYILLSILALSSILTQTGPGAKPSKKITLGMPGIVNSHYTPPTHQSPHHTGPSLGQLTAASPQDDPSTTGGAATYESSVASHPDERVAHASVPMNLTHSTSDSSHPMLGTDSSTYTPGHVSLSSSMMGTSSSTHAPISTKQGHMLRVSNFDSSTGTGEGMYQESGKPAQHVLLMDVSHEDTAQYNGKTVAIVPTPSGSGVTLSAPSSHSGVTLETSDSSHSHLLGDDSSTWGPSSSSHNVSFTNDNPQPNNGQPSGIQLHTGHVDSSSDVHLDTSSGGSSSSSSPSRVGGNPATWGPPLGSN